VENCQKGHKSWYTVGIRSKQRLLFIYLRPTLIKRLTEERKEHWRQLIGWGVILGILTGFAIDRYVQSEVAKIVYIKTVHAEEVKELEEKILIEVKIDWTKERIEQEIRTVFHEEPNTAVAIAKCESGLNADIQSHHTLSYGREQSFGIFQIHAKDHDKTAKRLGFEDYRTNVEDNVAMARFLYDSRGNFRDWTCYNSGAYKRFL
jgi:hypothetical protein